MDIFTSSDLARIIQDKFLVIIGDSIQRSIYKDIVLLLQEERYMTDRELRSKGEISIFGDALIEGGCRGEMSNGISYREVRQYKTSAHLVRFYFVTRCYNTYIESILSDLQKDPFPDLIILNSCLWDITRYGRDAITDYKDNLVKLFSRFYETLRPECLVVWNTTLPISSSARGGFLVPEIEFMTTTLRLDILEANYYAQGVATRYGFDILDLHFYLRHQLHRRVRDGIHWDQIAHRQITNIILTHVCESWNIPIPKRPVTFGSYGSSHARNGHYQHVEKPYEQTINGLSQLMNTFNHRMINVMASNLFQGCTALQDNSQGFPHGSSQNYNWMPYQESSYHGAAERGRSRFNPYRRQRH